MTLEVANPTGVNAASANPAEDITNKIRLFGLGTGQTTDRVRPLRLNTMQENLLLEAMMRGTSGLDRDQFAQNPWGFPFIPFPNISGTFNGAYRILVPEGVGLNIGQHPIYWIDEELTTPTEDEQNDPARWCVRMFYLIMAFGLWDEKLRWISAPCVKLKIGSVGSVEFENYVKGFESSLSEVRFTENDLLIPLEAVENEAANAVAQCVRMQKNSWSTYRSEQLAAYRYTVRLLDEPDFTPWNELSSVLGNLCGDIAEAHEGRQSLSVYVEPLFDIINRIVEFFNRLETNNLILSAVSLRNHSASLSEYNRIQAGLSQFQDQIVNSGYEIQLQELGNRMINEADDSSGPDHFAKIYATASDLYVNIERRLRLQAVNYARILNDQAPFATYTEMEIIQSTAESIGADNLPTVDALSTRY